MHLLQGGVDTTVMALWLGHESPVTTHGYVKADLRRKQQALNLLAAPGVCSARFQPKDLLLRFLKSL
jgi:integrase